MPVIDQHAAMRGSLTGPCEGGVYLASVPADYEPPYLPRDVRVGGAGDIVCELKDGSTVTFKALAAGERLPYRIQKFLAGTTATHIVLGW